MPQLYSDYKEYRITVWTDRQGCWRWVVQSPFDPHVVLGRSGPLKDVKSAEETIASAERWIDVCNDDEANLPSSGAAIANAKTWTDNQETRERAKQVSDRYWDEYGRKEADEYGSEEAEDLARNAPPIPEPIDTPVIARGWLEVELQQQKQELERTVKQIEALQANIPTLEGNIAALRQALVVHAKRHCDHK